MLLDKTLAVINELNNEVAERGELIECLIIGLLTRKNVFSLGDTGQAKSYAINELRKRIIGAIQYERLLSKQTDEDALFGRISVKSLMEDNPKMVTTGKIPEAHIVYLDETFKCNEGVLNSLLTALNERRYTNEGEVVDIPVILFIGASNEIPNFNNPEEQILRPLYDRFELKVITQYIQNRDNRLRMLSRKQNGQAGQITATITLDELYAMQREVASVAVPEQINELMDDIMCKLRVLGVHVSDRKFLNYYPIAQAKAWLCGRKIVEATDLSVMQYYLWTAPEEIPTIQKVLDKFCLNPLQEELKAMIALADESRNDFVANVDSNPTGAVVKLREELKKIYRMMKKLQASAEDKAEIAKAIEELEAISKEAHESVGFTYATLNLL